MKSTFMAGTVQGTKSEIKKANKVANIIVASIMIGFFVALITVLSSTGAFAQNLTEELGKPMVSVLDNIKLDPDVNEYVSGRDRSGRDFILTTYFDNGNTVRHIFIDKKCVSIDFRSTNFRNYEKYNKIMNETASTVTFDKMRKREVSYSLDTKITRGMWFIKVREY